MDPRIQELLARLGEVTDDQLADLEDVVLAQIEEAAEAKDVDAARALADAVGKVRTERGERLAQAEAREAEIASIMATVRAQDEDAPADDDADEADSDADPSEGEPAEGDDDSEADPATNKIAASSRPLPKIADLARVKRATTTNHNKKSDRSHSGGSVISVGDVIGYPAGTLLTNKTDLRKVFVEKFKSLGSSRGIDARMPVARFQYELPEERTLRAQDPEGNWNKIDALLSPQALVAAGGICTSPAAHYDFLTLGVASRPIRDGLPRFGAERGGIRFIPASTVNDFAAGVDVITEAEDAASATKPCVTITCGTVEEVLIAAISHCAQFGNFDARTNPEHVSHVLDLLMARHAREAEQQLFDTMCTASTAVTTGEQLSAYRDIVFNLGRLGAQYRSRHRMNPESTLRWVAPAWVRDMIRVDAAQQMPGDGTQAVSNAQIDGWIRGYGIAPIWSLDEGAYPAQGAGAALGWTSTFRSLLYAEGTFLFLDGGTLDLGIVRDSTLNLSNNFQAFGESFENVAQVGNESLCVTMDVCPNGLSAGQDDSPRNCTQGS